MVLILTSCDLPAPSESMNGRDHETAEEPAGIVSALATPSQVAWEWEVPEGTELASVEAITSGVAIVLTDGVVALRGDTGEELWHYRRPDGSTSGHGVTPDGSSVLISYAPGDGREHDLVRLESSTGEITSEYTSAFLEDSQQPHTLLSTQPDLAWFGALSDHSRVLYSLDPDTGLGLHGLDLDTGEESWNRTDLLEEPGFSPGPFVVSGQTVVLSGTTEEPEAGAVTIGINAETGEEVWREERPIERPSEHIGLSTYPGSNLVLARIPTDGYVAIDPGTGSVVSQPTIEVEDPIGFSNSSYVYSRWDSETDSSTYVRQDFEGDGVLTMPPPASADPFAERFVASLDDSLARLAINKDGENWGEAQLVVMPWDGGEQDTIDLGIEVRRESEQDGTTDRGFVLPDVMTVAPGALVVQGQSMTTDADAPDRVVGVN
ncbi:PQQ-binding-like beta-propeller repeat protein [Nocardiopsis aegyptia]|uniref:outer membrane protein assembly factor BamB family protein n=1 Tax=Nocardiopsis aegyptia TaxID=220378 RepID=UPI00366B6B48